MSLAQETNRILSTLQDALEFVIVVIWPVLLEITIQCN